ncbi:MAG: hydrogenase small subunit [Coriobacteriia bacterium]|nr:hydrogenase small subunit [Coriobacteriia bacterium]MCL2537011.1 hydrogenase small subunit [Coriobacteriia bacterium]
MGSEMTFYENLSQRGVSRRDFLKFCGSTAAVLGLSSTFVPTLASKIAGAAESGLTPAIWATGGKCTGCLESTLQATYPNVADIVLDLLTLNYSAASMATGKYAGEAKKGVYEGDRPFIMIYEGAIMTGLGGNTLVNADKTTSLDDLEHVMHSPNLKAIIAMGQCAVDGGWTRAFPNPAGGMGIKYYLEQEGLDHVPVVNLPGCPASPEELTAVVVQALLLGSDGTLETGIQAVAADLDRLNRPKYLYNATIHDSCPRRGHFENGEFVHRYGSDAEKKNWCVYPMGCKGPQTYRRCPMMRWNDAQSWCVESGGICIGCATWNWVDNNAPFKGRHRRVGANNILPGVWKGGINPIGTAAALTGVVAAALVAHGFGMKAAGRCGKNATLKTEEMKEYDRKRLKKQGGA